MPLSDVLGPADPFAAAQMMQRDRELGIRTAAMIAEAVQAGIRARQQAERMQSDREAQERADVRRAFEEDRRFDFDERKWKEENARRAFEEDRRFDFDERKWKEENAPFVMPGESVLPSLPEGPLPEGPEGSTMQLNATGYHPYDVRTRAEDRMEGGTKTAAGGKVLTKGMFERGEAPHVSVAVPQGSSLFGQYLTSPDAPGYLFKADDHFGTLGGKKIQGPRIDIAVDDRKQASAVTGPMRFTSRGDDLAEIAALIGRDRNLSNKAKRSVYQQAATSVLSRKPATAAESIEEMTAGMEFVPEHNTYRRKDGSQYFVSRGASGKVSLQPFKPKEATAKWLKIGSDRNVYAFGSNGLPMQAIPDGVTFPEGLKTTRDNLGNVFELRPDSTVRLLIPAQAKLTTKERDELVSATTAESEARADYEAQKTALEQNGDNWFGTSKKRVDEAKSQWDAAQGRLKAIREAHKELAPLAAEPLALEPVTNSVKPRYVFTGPSAAQSGPSAAAAAKPSAMADERRQSLENAKATSRRAPSQRAAIIARLKANGFTDAEINGAGL